MWRKSSFSTGGNTDCVEVALGETGAAVRDSKDPRGMILRVSVGAWRRLVVTTRTGDMTT